MFACNVLSLSADHFLPPSLIFNGPAVADRMCYRLAINRIQNKAPGSAVPTGNNAQRPVASTPQVKKLLISLIQPTSRICLSVRGESQPVWQGEGKKQNNERSAIRTGGGRRDGRRFTLLITSGQLASAEEAPTHQSFPLAQRVDRLQVGVAVQRVRVHAVLEGLHLLDDLLERRVFDAHVVDGVQQGNAVGEALLHLLRARYLS